MYVQAGMALRFVDVEKAYDTVLREMVMEILIRMGVPEAEAGLMEAMQEGMKERVLVSHRFAEEFSGRCQ